jgi:cell division protein FtsZ
LELSIDGAKGILFTITGGDDLGMHEVAEAAKIITGSADEDARVIFGANIDDGMKDEVRVTVVATGFDSREHRKAAPDAVEVQAQGTWTPSSFLRVRDENTVPVKSEMNFPTVKPRTEEVPVTAKSMQHTPPPAPVQPKPIAKIPKASTEEEEIEIPAFIRKKMM